jgi:putative heme-binding domain-containing protein
LWTLEGLGALDPGTITRALGDGDPGVRENAVLLAELNGSVPGLDARLASLASDPDPRVRFQVLATLGGLDTAVAATAHERLLFSQLEDRWMQIAGLSAGSGRAARYFARATSDGDPITARESEGHAHFIRQVAAVIGARGQVPEIARVIEAVAAPDGRASPAEGGWWRAAALEGLADSGRGRPSARASLESSRGRLLALTDNASARVRAGALHLLAIAGLGDSDAARQALLRAERVARTRTGDEARRADAIGLLALDRGTDRTPLLQALVDPREPEPVQSGAIRALGQRPGRPIGTFLLGRWPQLTPAARSEAADALLGDESRTWLLVDAIRSGVVQPWGLNFNQKRRLIMNRSERIRAAARAVLEEDPRQRGRTVQRYAAALDMAGDPARGEQVFATACAACHALSGKGGDLGPDLATVRHRPPLLLLADILLPSQSIAQKYETYVVDRNSGTTESGVLAAQTPTSVTLRQGDTQQVTIPRAEIRRMTVSQQSAMPADLDKLITPAEMADLLAFLRR